MEHLVEGIALLRHWYINPNEKCNKYKSSLLSSITKSLIEHFIQENVPLKLESTTENESCLCKSGLFTKESPILDK